MRTKGFCVMTPEVEQLITGMKAEHAARKNPSQLTDAQHLRSLKQALERLTTTVSDCLAAYDYWLAQPATREREYRLAHVSSDLAMANDTAQSEGLGRSVAALVRHRNAATRRVQERIRIFRVGGGQEVSPDLTARKK